MKKIITAIGDKRLNEQLKKEKLEVLGKDIQYLEGIFEQLEVNKNVDIIILSTNLLIDNNYKEFIYRINLINKNIKIIIIIEKKDNEIVKYLKSKNIKYYFECSNKYSKYLINYLRINKLKINKKFKLKNFKKVKKTTCKIITVTGINGVGKTLFTSLFSKIKKEKVMIIDLDKGANSLHILYNVNKKIKNKDKKLKIINIDNNIDLLINTYIKNNINKMNTMINKYKTIYDYIIIDLASFSKNYQIKQILKKSNKNIFFTEGNILQIKKSKELLDVYINNWNIPKEKFNIVLSKRNKNTIRTQIIKNSLYNINTIGEIKYNSNIDNLINNNLKNLKIYPKIVKEYKKIIDKI